MSLRSDDFAEGYVTHVDIHVGDRSATTTSTSCALSFHGSRDGARVGDVVGRDRRVVQFAVDGHVVHEILYEPPVLAAQHERTQAYGRPLGVDLEITQVDKAAVDEEPSRKLSILKPQCSVVEKLRMLPPIMPPPPPPLQREALDEGRRMFEVHVAVVDTVLGVAVFAVFDDECEVVDLYVAYPEAEIAAVAFFPFFEGGPSPA